MTTAVDELTYQQILWHCNAALFIFPLLRALLPSSRRLLRLEACRAGGES